jgi:hypothetical protein
MTIQFQTKQLQIADAQSVQDCYDSQPKLMLAPKTVGERPYAETFRALMQSGCIAYGAFKDDVLMAFCVVWPWPSQPTSTLVLFVNRPTGALFNPRTSGLQAAIDGALFHLEQLGYSALYFARAKSDRWKNSVVTRRIGRLGEYHAIPAEIIPSGGHSRYHDVNNYVLGRTPVRREAVLVLAVKPYDEDF